MRYLEMGIAFAAIGFVLANAAFSMLAVALWRAAQQSKPRAGTIFLIRMLPAIGSAIVVLGLVLPSYWSFEPRSTGERAGPALLLFVLLASALVGAGLYRVIASWMHTRRLARLWKTAAVPGATFHAGVPGYLVPSPMPFAALVGVVRPRLFVSDQFLDALTEGERQAVLDHEAGHHRSLDNLKRVAMKLAPDWLAFFKAGKAIEAAWGIAAEEEADDHAAGSGERHSLDLAGALLKAMRTAPLSCPHVSNFCEGSTIAHRVQRLLSDAPRRRRPARALRARLVWAAAFVGTAALIAAPAVRASYEATEAAIRLLQ